MGLTLNSIHDAFDDVFLNQFKTSDSSLILFRFDRFGSVITEADFVDPNHPELGVNQNLARERFSMIVNRVPVDNGDGISIVLTQDGVDDAYFFQMLTPARPRLSSSMDDETKSATTDSFFALKAAAQKKWDEVQLESSSGLMLEYRPSLATPSTWYDANNNDMWTPQSVNIGTQPAPPQQPPNRPTNNVWRLKLSDAAIEGILHSNTAALPQPIVKKMVMIRPAVAVQAPAAALPPTGTWGIVRGNRVESFATRSPAGASALLRAASAPAPQPAMESFVLHDVLRQALPTLTLQEQMSVRQIIATTAPTQPTTTTNISVAFSYCVVNIQRPWFFDAFVNDQSWCLPGIGKGDLTDPVKGKLPYLPVGFVAVKDLKIQAVWAPADLAAAEQATDFGPFRIDSAVINNTLSHKGIQIIGWLLQKMPTVPPNDFTAS